MNKTYAGIGSRETPSEVLALMTSVATILENAGYKLRSGRADGADLAFEKGVFDAKNKEIFLPFKNFNWKSWDNKQIGTESTFILDQMECKDKAYATVDEFHPNPYALRRKGPMPVQLMARNSFQVLGPNHDSPVDFIICWTIGGRIAGGTGQALRIARKYNIKVFNLGSSEGVADLKLFLKSL